MQSSASVLVTGAAAGIGRAITLRFLRAGYRVAAFDIDTEGLASLSAQTPGSQLTTGELDVRDPAAWQEALAQVSVLTGGQLQVLINNAGILASGRFADIPLASQRRIIDVNVVGTLNGCHAAYPLLKATPGAQVLNLCSSSAIYGQPEPAIYSASKFAVRGLTEALDLEWRQEDIRVRALWPLFVNHRHGGGHGHREHPCSRRPPHARTGRRGGAEHRPPATPAADPFGAPRRGGAVARDDDGSLAVAQLGKPTGEQGVGQPMSTTPDATVLDVAVIGAGFGGLCLAIKLKEQGLRSFVVLERGSDIGGTWRENTYPGAACDVPSAMYSYSFFRGGGPVPTHRSRRSCATSTARRSTSACAATCGSTLRSRPPPSMTGQPYGASSWPTVTPSVHESLSRQLASCTVP